MYRGIIFDMDNTLLQSRIDFSALKLEVHRFLAEQGVIGASVSAENHTCSTLIELGLASGMTPAQEERMWRIAEKHELAGMEGAGLEEGACELLERLQERFVVTVLTNNSQAAAQKALRETGVWNRFDLVVGRERAGALKPSAQGVRSILQAYPHIPSAGWISVGDAWIDGKAAQDAGVAFISYGGELEFMRGKGVFPVCRIDRLLELSDILGTA